MVSCCFKPKPSFGHQPQAGLAWNYQSDRSAGILSLQSRQTEQWPLFEKQFCILVSNFEDHNKLYELILSSFIDTKEELISIISQLWSHRLLSKAASKHSIYFTATKVQWLSSVLEQSMLQQKYKCKSEKNTNANLVGKQLSWSVWALQWQEVLLTYRSSQGHQWSQKAL